MKLIDSADIYNSRIDYLIHVLVYDAWISSSLKRSIIMIKFHF